MTTPANTRSNIGVRVGPPPGVPVSYLDPYSDEVLADPYPHYQTLRDMGPVVWLEKYAVLAVARSEQVSRVLADPQAFCSSAGVGLTNFHTETPWREPSIILEADPPDHSRTRKVFTRILSPKALNRLRDTFEKEADALVSAMIAKGDCDAVTDLSHAYPIKVFGDAVGVPEEGREYLLDYGDMVFNAFGPTNDRFQRCRDKLGPALEWIGNACRREVLTDDGFGAQLYAAADAGEITEQEAGLLVRTMLSAGLDTTIFTLGNALASLARFPHQWAILRENPSLARDVLEEVLRYESTFQSFCRTASRPVVFEGIPIRAEQKILVFIASANRDPRRWNNPDSFDVTRKATGNVAFGTGIHGCAGQMIARLEGEIVLQALASRIETLELTGEPKIHFNNTVRGYTSIPMRVVPRKSR